MSSWDDLREYVRQLLNDPNGCSWLQSQSFRSIANYSQEEIYELIDAIESENVDHIQDELADLCFHLVIYTEMKERGHQFTLDQVASRALEKLSQRQRQDKIEALCADQSHAYWQAVKHRKTYQQTGSYLSNIPRALPALLQANKILDSVAQIGFVFPSVMTARSKVSEELAELDEAIAKNDTDCCADEIGDVLFSIVALAKQLNINSEEALRSANNRFTDRIRFIENKAQSDGRELDSLTEEELLSYYRAAKERYSE